MKLVKECRKQGLTVERTGSGHWKVSNADGEFVIMAFSPGKGGRHKTMKRLEGIGFEAKGK